MNIKEIRNRNAKKLESGSKFGSHINCVHINPSNSLEHERKKLDLCHALRVLGKDFYTETKFTNGTRADMYCLDDDIAYEIVCTEKEESIIRKKTVYPCDVLVVKV